MVDGGIGLVKVALLRFLKIKILTKVRTTLHDHVMGLYKKELSEKPKIC